MSYRVLWSPHAEERLEGILQDLSAQASCAQAARQIDAVLLNDPLGFGESRVEAVRIGFVHPLGVHYEVLEDVRTVVVYHVWRIDRRLGA